MGVSPGRADHLYNTGSEAYCGKHGTLACRLLKDQVHTVIGFVTTWPVNLNDLDDPVENRLALVTTCGLQVFENQRHIRRMTRRELPFQVADRLIPAQLRAGPLGMDPAQVEPAFRGAEPPRSMSLKESSPETRTVPGIRFPAISA